MRIDIIAIFPDMFTGVFGNSILKRALDKIGKEQAKAYYCHDHTHNSIKGARLNAVNIANGLRQIGLGQLVISEKALKKYLKQNQK